MSRRSPHVSTSRLLRFPALVLAVLATLTVAPSDGNPVSAEEPEAPARPAGLRVATEQGSLGVSLDWDDVAGAARYWVRWRMAGPGNTLNPGVETTSSQADITVAGYGQWVARVQACNDASCGKPVTKKFRVEPAPEPESDSTPEPTAKSAPEPESDSTSTPESTPKPAPALHVSVSASPASPEANQFATLSASIFNLPFDSGAPNYNWQIQRAGGWDSVWTGPTLFYSSKSQISVTFRLTVSFASGISDTSDPLTVTWSGDPPPVVVHPEPVIRTLDVGSADCELAPPERVSALGVARAAVAFWEAPSDGDACEPTGYLVGARNVDAGAWTSELVAASARSHVLDGLTPGRTEYEVLSIYREGVSERPIALPQTFVPEACDITLSVEANVDRGISGTWINVAGTPTGCVFGPEVEFQFKQSTWDHFRNYGLFPNDPPSGPGQPSFIGYDLEPGVTYDFKIVAVDAAGRKNESNVASATVLYDAGAADEHSPRDVRVAPHNRGDAYVEWSDPASLGSGRTLTKFVVEWTTAAGAPMTAEIDPAAANGHRITGLTDSSVYTVRVAARTTDASSNMYDAWSAPTAPFTARVEPIQVWFTRNTPWISASSGLLFSRVQYNIPAANTVCEFNDGGVDGTLNCPRVTLVYTEVTGDVTIRARSIVEGDITAYSSEHESDFGGPRPVDAHASGGNGTLVIVWGNFGEPGHGGIGTHDAWVVQHRQQNTDGTWPSWPSGHVIADATARSHTFTGLANGTWQVRVRARSANEEDHDGDSNTPDQTVHRLGFTSEIRTVTLAAGNAAKPGRPTAVTAKPGRPISDDDDEAPGVGTLVVEWEPPSGGGSAVYAYQVRHRRGDYDYSDGGENWTVSPELFPRQTWRMCRGEALDGCENPRRYVVSNLIGGRDYDVGVRAKNANGWGEWQTLFSGFYLPNGFPPILQSAEIDGANLTLTFDRSLDTDSRPSTSVFLVTVNGTSQAPTAVAISGNTLTLTLGTAATNGQTVMVSYFRPPATPLQHNDAQGPSFSDEAVTNITP